MRFRKLGRSETGSYTRRDGDSKDRLYSKRHAPVSGGDLIYRRATTGKDESLQAGAVVRPGRRFFVGRGGTEDDVVLEGRTNDLEAGG